MLFTTQLGFIDTSGDENLTADRSFKALSVIVVIFKDLGRVKTTDLL